MTSRSPASEWCRKRTLMEEKDEGQSDERRKDTSPKKYTADRQSSMKDESLSHLALLVECLPQLATATGYEFRIASFSIERKIGTSSTSGDVARMIKKIKFRASTADRRNLDLVGWIIVLKRSIDLETARTRRRDVADDGKLGNYVKRIGMLRITLRKKH